MTVIDKCKFCFKFFFLVARSGQNGASPNYYVFVQELAVDPSFEFEKRRNVPVKYDRELWTQTIAAMQVSGYDFH